MIFTRSILAVLLSLFAAISVSAQRTLSPVIDNNRYIYLGNDDVALHLVWEEHPAYRMDRYVIEKSYDGNHFFAIDSVYPSNLFDIHINDYPDNINYYNRILYSTETGGGRFIYNDVRDVSEAGEKNFWYRIKMVKPNGDKIYTRTVLQSFQFGIADIDRLREVGGAGGNQRGGGVILGDGDGSGAGGPRGSGPCPNIQAPPSGYIFNGGIRTFYGECCYWEEREYVTQQITEACNGVQSWCCPRDCSPLAYDPCCYHICNEYNQCSCHPWTCCDVASGGIWIVTSSTTYAIGASVTGAQNPACTGNFDGSVTVNNLDGIQPITYFWENGTITGSILNQLAAGVYSLTVSDANGCSETLSFNIVAPPGITSSFVSGDVSCFGLNDGFIDVSVNGGTQPYTYIWTGGNSNGATSQDLLGIGAGNYALTVSDANNCVSNQFAPIFSPDEFTGVVTFLDLSCLNANSAVLALCCYGTNTGSAVLSLSGGTPPNTFIWSNGATTPVNTDLTSGTYAATAVDANGCSFVVSSTLNEPAEIVLSFASTKATCGQCNGTANIIVNGGSGLFNFTWPPSVGNQTTANVTGLCAGSYSVLVSDAFAVGCSKTITVSISNDGGETINTSHTDASCAGVCNGTASVNFNCSSPPCTVAWFDPAGVSFSPGNSVSNLCEGSYSVVVTNFAGCITAETVDIQEGDPITANLNVTHESCPSACDGNVAATPLGGSAPYTYQWQDSLGNPIPLQTNSSIQNLCPGNYGVVITDAEGCAVTQTFVIIPNIFSISTTQSDLLCNGVCNGSITIDVSGGAGPFTYQWLDAGSNPIAGATNATVFNLCAGTYYAQVATSTNCALTSPPVIITEPAAITAVINSTDIPCAGQCIGDATVLAGGGAGGYTYQWYNAANVAITGETNPSISNLCEGTYFVVITDLNGCATEPQQVDILVLTTILLTLAPENISCNDMNDGSINLTVSGGTLPITFSWNNGTYTDQNIFNLTEGQYDVVVTDVTGCTTTNGAYIVNPGELTASATPFIFPNNAHVSCHNGSNGRATVVVTGGTPPFNYLWSDSQQAPIAIGLSLGTHTVTVIDASGCSVVTDVTLYLNPLPMLITLVADTFIGGWNVSCFGASDGFIDLTVTNGMPPLVYSWQPGDIVFIEDLPGVSAITYTAYVTDTVNNCSVIDSITLIQPAPLSASFLPVDASCRGGNDGAVDLTISGGTQGYTYSWNDGTFTSQNISGLTAGTYAVSVTDTNGCMLIDSIAIAEPTNIPVGNVSIVTCRDSVFVGGVFQTVSGIYDDTVQYGAASCDSVVVTDLQFVSGFLVPDSVSICDGSSYFVGGALQSAAGVYYDTLIAVGNCDSVIETHLSLITSYFVSIDASICDDVFYFAGGANQNTSGVYLDSFIAVGGCDSTVETNLTVFPTFDVSRTVSICEGESFLAGGALQTTSGFYYDTLATIHGCDSVLETQLIVNPLQLITRAIQICNGDSFFVSGSYQTTDGVYYDSLFTAAGCDSIVETALATVTGFFIPVQETICNGESFLAGGSLQTAPGIYYDILSSTGGCDSIVETTLNVITVSIRAEPDSATVQSRSTVDITIIGGTGNLTYAWTPVQGLSCIDADCAEITIVSSSDISYTVIAVDSFGCADTSTIFIYVVNDSLDPNSEFPLFYVPNAFTPNGDGNNDEFKVTVTDYSSFRLLVFNRWGEKLFETNNPAVGWNGTYRGKSQNPGVYVYYLDISFINNMKPPDYLKYNKGSVTLIR